jgi:hypothetical protein
LHGLLACCDTLFAIKQYCLRSIIADAVNLQLHAAYQKAVHEKRMAQEVATSKRERDFYLSKVSQAKKNDAILTRKRQVRF